MTVNRTILVTCVGGRFIYDIVRALRSAPDFRARIIGCDANPETEGRVLTDRFVSLPSDPDEYIAGLFALAAEERIDLVLPLSEHESRILSRRRAEMLSRGIATATSDFATVDAMTDKLTMLQRVKAGGVETVEFRAVDTLDDLEAALTALGYPQRVVVVKPRRSSGARGVMVFDEQVAQDSYQRGLRGSGRGAKSEILADLAKANASLNGFVAVGYLDGPVYDVDCIAVDGVATDIVPRLRQWRDPLSPSSTGNKIEMNSAVIDYCRALCRVFGVQGSADFDIALDERGRPRVFDAGTRLSGSVGGAFVAGANIPAQLVRVLTGLPRQEFAVRDGCVVRPFMTFAEVPPERQDVLF